MRKDPKEIAALIIGSAKKPKHLLERPDEFGAQEEMEGEDEYGEDGGEELQLLAGDIFDALKQDDEESFVDALVTLVKSCHEGR